MKEKSVEEPFPIQLCLLLNVMILQARYSINDYACFLMASDLEPEGNYQLTADMRDEIDNWLTQFGDMSFRDLPHLQRIADLIKRAFFAKKGKGPRLGTAERRDLADWQAQCKANRLFYKRITWIPLWKRKWVQI